METFFQYLVNGIVMGSMYALLAIGLSLTFSIMRILNFAHGEFYMVGAYVCWVVLTFVVDSYWLAFVIAVGVGAAMGFLVERGVYRRSYGKPYTTQLIISIGVLLFLQEAAVALFYGGVTQKIVNPYPTVRHLGNIYITDQRLLMVGLTVVILAAFFLFISRSRTGKAMRASSGNRLAAMLLGVNINRMSSTAFMIGVALAAVAAGLLAPLYGLDPFMGSRMLGICIAIIVVGGLGSTGGALVAGYTIGIAESLFCGYISAEWSLALVFGMLILVLMVRPRGFFGRE